MSMDVDFSHESNLASLRSVIKWEIQHLLSRLSGIGEETLVLSVSVLDGSLTELGSNVGLGFFSINDCNRLKKEFLAYCRGFHHVSKESSSDVHIDGTFHSPESLIQNHRHSVKRKAWRKEYLQSSKLSRLCVNGKTDLSKHDSGPLTDGCSNGLDIGASHQRWTTDLLPKAKSRRKRTPHKLRSIPISDLPENSIADECEDIYLDVDEPYTHNVDGASLEQLTEESVLVPESVTVYEDTHLTESSVAWKVEKFNIECMDYDETCTTIPQLLPNSTENNFSTCDTKTNFTTSDTKTNHPTFDTKTNFPTSDTKTNHPTSDTKTNFPTSDTKTNFPTSDTKTNHPTSDTKTNFPTSDTNCELDLQCDTILDSSVSSKFDSVSMVSNRCQFPVFRELRQNKRTVSYNEDNHDEIPDSVMSSFVDDSQSKCANTKNSNTTKNIPGSKKHKEQNCDINSSKKKSFKPVDEYSGESMLLDACKMQCGRYQCPLCHQKTRDRHDLKRHLRTHTKEKPYQCEICERKFTRKWDLENHITRHLDKDTNCSISASTKINSPSVKKSSVSDLSYNKLIRELLIKMNITNEVDQNGSVEVGLIEHVGGNHPDKSSTSSGNDGESEMSNSSDVVLTSSKTAVKTEHCYDLENSFDQSDTSEIKEPVLDDR